MELINTFDDFYRHLSLLTECRAVTIYRSIAGDESLTSGPVFAYLRSIYGQEVVAHKEYLSQGGKKRTEVFTAKSLLIDELVQFVVENPELFTLNATTIFIEGCKLAAEAAEDAEADIDGVTRPDPRYDTCYAVADGLKKIAVCYANQGVESDIVAKYAILTLIDLGIRNNAQIDRCEDLLQRVAVKDASLIGFGYIESLISLAAYEGTARLTSQMLGKAGIKSEESLRYTASVASTAGHYADALGYGKLVRSTLAEFHPPTICNIDRPVLLLVDGLRFCSPDSREANFISDALCGILSDDQLKSQAVTLVDWVEARLRAQTGSYQDMIMGGNLIETAPLLIATLRRTMDPDASRLLSPQNNPELKP